MALLSQPEPQPAKPAPPPIVYLGFSNYIEHRGAQSLMNVVATVYNGGTRQIHLGISSLGGFPDQAVYLFNALRALPIELTTHNLATVQSAANILFLAGSRRFSCPNSTFMMHHTSHGGGTPISYTQSTIKDRFETLLIDDEITADITASETQQPLKNVKRWFRGNVVRDTNFALQNGLIHQVQPFKVPVGAPFVQIIV